MAKKNSEHKEQKHEEVIFDAQGISLGRMASIAAKSALLNHEVVVLNSEQAIVTGRREFIFAEFKAKVDRGDPTNGPFYPRLPHLMVKRIIRGMLPWKRTRGREAYRRIKCYIGVPDEFKSKKVTPFAKNFTVKKIRSDYVTIKEISQYLGARI